MVIRWGAVAKGREAKALEVFAQAGEDAERRVKDGEVDSTDVYISLSGTRGYRVHRGDLDALFNLQQSSEFRQLISRSSAVVDDLEVEIYMGGDADTIMTGISDYMTGLGAAGVL